MALRGHCHHHPHLSQGQCLAAAAIELGTEPELDHRQQVPLSAQYQLWPVMPQCRSKRPTLAHLTFQHSDGSQPGLAHTTATMSILSICLPLPGMTYVCAWQPQPLSGDQSVACGSQVLSKLLEGGHRWRRRGKGGARQPLPVIHAVLTSSPRQGASLGCAAGMEAKGFPFVGCIFYPELSSDLFFW